MPLGGPLYIHPCTLDGRIPAANTRPMAYTPMIQSCLMTAVVGKIKEPLIN